MLDFRTETFLTVCQTMNFTAAARQLNITQPAVSQHIHFLEEQYHTSLFIYQNKQGEREVWMSDRLKTLVLEE